MGQVVDTESAREFMKEVLAQVDEEELRSICEELENKSLWFGQTLNRDSLGALSSEDWYSLLRRVFATRRRAARILEKLSLGDLREWTAALLYGDSPIQNRFDEFVGKLKDFDPNLRRDLASELLHFNEPDKYWLWTRWMWDPGTRTGALPLVTYAAYDFSGPSDGEVYLRVGEAVTFVHQVGEAAGFQTMSKGLFGTDTFLCSVYVIYVYTVLRLRMTQEFNKVMPGLAEFSRRLLGVHERANPPVAAQV